MNGLIREHGNCLDEESLRMFLCQAEYNQQQNCDSGDSKRPPLGTPIIARYAAYWKNKTCAAPTWRV